MLPSSPRKETISKRAQILAQLDYVGNYFFERLQRVEDYLKNNVNEHGIQMEEVRKPRLNFDEDSQDEEGDDVFGMSFDKRAGVTANSPNTPRPNDSVPQSPPSNGADTTTDKGSDTSPNNSKHWIEEEEEAFDLM